MITHTVVTFYITTQLHNEDETNIGTSITFELQMVQMHIQHFLMKDTLVQVLHLIE